MVDGRMILGAEMVGGIGENNFSIFQKDNFVENVLNIGNEVSGNEKAGTVVKISKNGIENIITSSRIDAAERFVENIKFGVAAHDENELEFFLHTFAHVEDFGFGIEIQILNETIGFVGIKVVIKI